MTEWLKQGNEEFTMISLPAALERAARLNPGGTATSFEGVEHSWSATRERVASLAAGLAALGLVASDRVAILSLNSARYYESIFAIPPGGLLPGATQNPVGTAGKQLRRARFGYPGPAVRRCLHRAGATIAGGCAGTGRGDLHG